ncbi:transglutaminase domain-containing protein [Floccifex sp.]|uniref:transglutaminase domain-containing protein n=1 Tax=Floccifex sp. TaxID=2815810 RepID=UPI002A74CE0D|nr:transglutaminase domain-containing protein [Floccifex sp.]MDY2957844.1 transglutaminase domain-containing protein [Floccifex sp.]
MKSIKKLLSLILCLSFFSIPIYGNEYKDWTNDSDFIVNLEEQNDTNLSFSIYFNQNHPSKDDTASIQLPTAYMNFENISEPVEIYSYKFGDENNEAQEIIGSYTINNGIVDIIFTNDEIDYSLIYGLIQVNGSFKEEAYNSTVSWKLNNNSSASLMLPTCTSELLLDEESENDSQCDVLYQSHVQRIGWQDYVKNGQTSGTQGQALRMEAIRIKLSDTDLNGSIQYRSHVQRIGWQDWKSNGELSGTTGQSLRLEAIQIKLTDELAQKYDIYYRVHSQGFGWLGWACNGQKAGTEGYYKRMEAIQIVLVEKGKPGYEVGNSFVSAYEKGLVTYQGQVQYNGWMNPVADGQTCGTIGESKRLESLKIHLTDDIDGGIEYRAHVQNIGWQNWVSDNEIAGTVGQGKRAEAFRIRLTGKAADLYNIYYRVHVQSFGWLDWASNGQKAGSEGFGKRIEAIEIKLVEKTSDTMITGGASFIDKQSVGNITYSVRFNDQWQEQKKQGNVAGDLSQNLYGLKCAYNANTLNGDISYSLYSTSDGWQKASSGNECIVSNKVEAIKVSLTGDLAKFYDVYYRTNVQNFGWLGWAKNNQVAGTTKIDHAIKGIEIQLCLKGNSPYQNANYYRETISQAQQYAHNVNQSLGNDLRKAFNYAKNFTYSRYEPADYNSYGSENYAVYGFKNRRGNCYVMAAAFTYLARDLGYEAYQVGGRQGSYNTPHSWVEIVVDGTTYVCDPDFEKELGRNGYMIRYGSSGSLKYHDYSRMN